MEVWQQTTATQQHVQKNEIVDANCSITTVLLDSVVIHPKLQIKSTRVGTLRSDVLHCLVQEWVKMGQIGINYRVTEKSITQGTW